jgi:uncharacterized protein with NRDE domain
MCLAVVALDAHPRYTLVVAANRDEFHARATAPAHWWDEGWLAGRDLAGGGTWLGVTRAGRWALLTNIREPARYDPLAPSRGELVTRVLAAPGDAGRALAEVAGDGACHNGFNLLAGEDGGAYWGSNRERQTRALAAGIHGLSNDRLDTPWPKVVRTKAAVAAWCAAGGTDAAALERLFAILGARQPAADSELPHTGIPLARERALSSPFIVSGEYGTRSSTVLAIARDGEARFVERSFDPAGEPLGEVDFRFRIDGAAAAGDPQPRQAASRRGAA